MQHTDDIRQRVAKLQVSHISDAMGRTGVPAGIRPQGRGFALFGPAFTVRAHPGDNLALHRALDSVPAGHILVVDGGGFTDIALWGELMSLDAMARGVSGLVIEGAVRDAGSFTELGFPVYARAVTPRGPFKTNAGEMQIPISCGGVPVSPGDYIVGDDEGLVVIPMKRLEAVVFAAERVAAREVELGSRIACGERLYDLLGLR